MSFVLLAITLSTTPDLSPDQSNAAMISAGTFYMGCVPKDRRCEPTESPRRRITLSRPYWLARARKRPSGSSDVIANEGGTPVLRMERQTRKAVTLTLLPKDGSTRADAQAAMATLLDRYWPGG